MDRSPPQAERPPGIRDVARAAGVSVASASVALNGRPGVARGDPRSAILAAAERLGYRANPQAQALRRGRTNTFGLVVRNFANPFFLDIISGAEEVAERGRRHAARARLALLARAGAAARRGDGRPARRGPGDRAGRDGESIRLWQSAAAGAPAVALNAAVDGASRA